MNKITSTLAGLAIAVTASIVPAFAQGNLFSPPGTFTFTGTAASAVFTASGTGEKFNPSGSLPTTTADFTLAGTAVSGFPGTFTVTSLTITPAGGATFTETNPLDFTVNTTPAGTTIASVGAASDGTTFNLVSAPVPEASTVISFGALLALGGLAVLRRKSVKA